MAVTFTKLKSGDWGLRGPVDLVKPGATVTVAKRDGTTDAKRVGRVIWSGGGVALATIASGSSASSGRSAARSRGRSSGTRTGCACGSIEEEEKASDCWTCQHDR
jgi:hypothetical protein